MPEISIGDSYTQNTSTNAPVETLAAKSGPGVLYALSLTNTNASDRFVFVFDSPSEATGNLLTAPIPVAANRHEVIEFRYPITAKNGIFIATSSTLATFTASGTDDVYVRALVK
jgi:hypothetical protein